MCRRPWRPGLACSLEATAARPTLSTLPAWRGSPRASRACAGSEPRTDHSAVLRLLSDRRDELTQGRRTVVNRLHRLLRDLHPGGAPTELSAEAAARLLGRIRPASVVDLERKVMAQALLVDLRRLDRALVLNRTRCAAAVLASGTTLTGVFWDQQRAGGQNPEVMSVTSAGSGRRITSRVHRYGPDRGLQRRGHPPSAFAQRQPLAQQRAASRGSGPDHASGPWARPLRAQARRAQVVSRDAPQPEAPTGEGRLSPSRRRSGP